MLCSKYDFLETDDFFKLAGFLVLTFYFDGFCMIKFQYLGKCEILIIMTFRSNVARGKVHV